MADFNKAFEWVVGNEGGFSNNPNDTGGATNWGITHNELASWRGHPVNVQDVMNLTIDEAKKIYKARYWDALSCDKIVNDGVATAVFDQAVNCGPSTAAKRAQGTIGVLVDGAVGPVTLAKLNSIDPEKFIIDFTKVTLEYYAGIVVKNPTQSVFILGWTRRGMRLLDLIAA